MSADYMIGFSAALNMMALRNIDWVGQWVVLPGGNMADGAERRSLLKKAAALGLVDQHHVMVFIGWAEGKIMSDTYIWPS